MSDDTAKPIPVDAPEAYVNRELSWLQFSRRVLALAEDESLPLLERVRFAGIVGMLHDEFFMKRMSGLKRQIANRKSSKKRSLDGRTPGQELDACREQILRQLDVLSRLFREGLRPALAEAGLPILDYDEVPEPQKIHLREYFRRSVLPILTPLAVDAEHPFPFISNLGLNLAVMLPQEPGEADRFVRIKVPGNRPRWVALADGSGYCPLEQIIAANLDLLFPTDPPSAIHEFRVTRGAEADVERVEDFNEDSALRAPGSIVEQVTGELKARRFAGVVRLQVGAAMPRKLRTWLAAQLELDHRDVYPTAELLRLSDLGDFEDDSREELRFPAHRPVTHPRLRGLDPGSPSDLFDEIARGDILLHHPYHSFDTSVLWFLEAAAVDPAVLAIKVTIYRTSRDSPIVRALAEAARRGKQVAVLVEITARFDEAPNIAWGRYLEKEGVHVSYGVERLKTHVKLALAVRDEPTGVRRYAHVGTGNYHTGTARLYEDLGILTCEPRLCEDVAAVFNELTGATPYRDYARMLVAPHAMRAQFVELIRREAEHAEAGRPAGIRGKMNQLQDPEIIRELYRAARRGVPISLGVRGLCCLRPGVPGLSENIRVYSIVGRFLEHSRIYHFVNGGDDAYYLGSADWMKRNLDRRFETVVPVDDPEVRDELARILETYETDNASAWDCGPDGEYVLRRPAPDEPRRAAQEAFIRGAREERRRARRREEVPG